MNTNWDDTVILPRATTHLPVAYSSRSTLREILTTCFRDRKRIALAFLIPFALTVVLSFLPTPRYTSEATLLLRQGREYLYKPEVGDANSSQPMAYDRELTLRAEVEILTSRDVKEATLARLGVAHLYPAIGQKVGDAARQRDAALLELQRRIDAVLVKDTNVVRLSFTHADAQVSAEVLNTLIDVYLDRRRVIFSRSTRADAEAEVSAVRARLNALEDRIETLKRVRKIQSFGEERTLLLAQRQSLEARLAESELLLTQSSSRAAALRTSLQSTPADVQISSETQRSEAIESARKTLLDLRLKERDLTSKFTDTHLGVLDVRADIGRTETFLRELEARPNRAVRTGRSPVRDGIESDLVRSLADQRQATASRVELVAQLAAIETRITSLSASQRELQSMDREHKLLEASYETAVRRFQDEQLLERLDQRRKSSVSVLQPARTPLESHSVRAAVLAVGAVVSLLCALLMAFISALWRDTYLSPEEVQRGLGLPLLAAVPRVMA